MNVLKKFSMVIAIVAVAMIIIPAKGYCVIPITDPFPEIIPVKTVGLPYSVSSLIMFLIITMIILIVIASLISHLLCV